jgi:hypothetical protein
MLYMPEMAPDSGLLLSTYTPSNPEKYKVSRCNMHFGGIQHYGKYH